MPAYVTPPSLMHCHPCGVAWGPKDKSCWLCGEPGGYVRQLSLTSQGAMSTAGIELERELAGERRDWEADPCGWQLAKEPALKFLARRLVGAGVLPAPDEQPDAGQ